MILVNDGSTDRTGEIMESFSKVIPEIAFAPDIKGVWSVEGTLELSSKPRNILRTNTKNNIFVKDRFI